MGICINLVRGAAWHAGVCRNMHHIFNDAKAVVRRGYWWLGIVALITISCEASRESEFTILQSPAPVSMTTSLEFLEPRVFTGGNFVGSAPPQEVLVFVVTSVRNVSDSVLSFSHGDFRLIDDRGMTFKYSLAAHTEYFMYELSEGCLSLPTPMQKLEDVHITGADVRGISLNCSSEWELIKSKLEKRWEIPPGGEVAGYDRILLIFDIRDASHPRQYKLAFRDDPPVSVGWIP